MLQPSKLNTLHDKKNPFTDYRPLRKTHNGSFLFLLPLNELNTFIKVPSSEPQAICSHKIRNNNDISVKLKSQ